MGAPLLIEAPLAGGAILAALLLTPGLAAQSACLPGGPATSGLGVRAEASALASTTARLNPLVPHRDADGDPSGGGIWPVGGASVRAERGPFRASLGARGDGWALDGDPDGDGRANGVVAYLDDTCIGVELSRFTVAAGWMRFDSLEHGLMLSRGPWSAPQLFLSARFGPFKASFAAAGLDSIGDTRRYLSAHRLTYERDGLTLSVGEAKLWTLEEFSFRVLNPLEPYALDAWRGRNDDELDTSGNSVVDFAVRARLGGADLSAELVLDDVFSEVEEAPERFAWTAELRAPELADRLGAGVSVRQVSAWAYRSSRPTDRWTHRGLGLGDPFADYTRLSAWVEVEPLQALRLTPVFAWQRKGEGDFRDPLPPPEEFAGAPVLHLGVVETTLRLALRGRWSPAAWAVTEWDAGLSRVTDAGHRPGDDRWEPGGTARIRLVYGAPPGG